MDSTFKVPYTTVKEIKPHPGADRLEIAIIYGFQVVVQKGRYKPGDKIIYCPIDSILNSELEKKLFPEDSKIKLHNSRVRQIRIRSLASQGLVIDPKDVADEEGYLPVGGWSMHTSDPDLLEYDLAEALDIKKYEPPVIGPSQTVGKDRDRLRAADNPNFRKYNGIGNLKWFPDLFTEDDEVVVQEKIHGSHIRWGRPPFVANTLWRKIKKFLGLAPKYEFVYGSNNVQISGKIMYSGYYGDDIYGALLKKYGVEEKTKDGEFFHGELYGDGVQKNYTYGCQPGEHKLVVFDHRVIHEDGTHTWSNPDEVSSICSLLDLPFVPILYTGKYNKELIQKLTEGPSVLAPAQKVREGVVIKDAKNFNNEQSKKCVKLISEAYLDDRSNTDHQ